MKGAMPILGTTGQIIYRAAFRPHRVPDFICEAGLDRHLNGLYGKGWYALLLKASGDAVLAGQMMNTPAPPEDVQERMLVVARKINGEVNHGGHWIVVWHRLNRLCLVWRDDEGGLQFELAFSEPWARVAAITTDDMAQRCEMAWQEWARQMGLVEVKPEQQTVKPAPDGGGSFKTA